MVYKPVPESRTVSVRPMDNSDENLVLQAELVRVLQAKGYTVVKDAPLVLVFETRDEAGSWSDGGRRTLLELQASGGGIGGDTQRARINVFDSQAGGLFNEGQGGTRVVTPDRYRLDLTLEEKGQRLWQGWATAETRLGSSVAASKPMIGPLVDNIGRTVRRQAITIP
ncbi:MAG: complement resistance protein TraT [Magnetospirillum sp. WYHS-4]